MCPDLIVLLLSCCFVTQFLLIYISGSYCLLVYHYHDYHYHNVQIYQYKKNNDNVMTNGGIVAQRQFPAMTHHELHVFLI